MSRLYPEGGEATPLRSRRGGLTTGRTRDAVGGSRRTDGVQKASQEPQQSASLKLLEPAGGVEPPTCRLQGGCSAS